MHTFTFTEIYPPDVTSSVDKVDVILEKVGICCCFDVVEAFCVVGIEEGLRGDS